MTKEEIQKMNLFEKMMNLTNEVEAVKKNGMIMGKIPTVTEPDVLAAVKSKEYVYRVYSYPFDREVITQGNGMLKIKTTYRFVNVDNPNEFIDMISFGYGVENDDKAPGKALSYSDKYALLKAYKMITGTDPDWEPVDVTRNTPIAPSEPKKEEKHEEKKIPDKVLEEMAKYDIRTDRLSAFLGKNPDELTEADMISAIKKKKETLAKRGK